MLLQGRYERLRKRAHGEKGATFELHDFWRQNLLKVQFCKKSYKDPGKLTVDDAYRQYKYFGLLFYEVICTDLWFVVFVFGLRESRNFLHCRKSHTLFVTIYVIIMHRASTRLIFFGG